MRAVVSTFALICLVPAPLLTCDAWIIPSLSRLSRLRLQRRPTTSPSAQSDAAPQITPLKSASGSSTRQAYFTHLLSKSVATVAISGASSLVVPPGLVYAYEDNGSRWLPEGDSKLAESWFPLVKKCYASLEDVLQNWDKYTARQDGDAIRRLIGTIGVSSPLSSVRRAFISIRDAEETSQGDIDVIEYVEAYLEVLTALGDAENDLYSSNFADYAGGGGTKGTQFIAKANKSLKIARDNFKEVNRILGI